MPRVCLFGFFLGWNRVSNAYKYGPNGPQVSAAFHLPPIYSQFFELFALDGNIPFLEYYKNMIEIEMATV